MRLNCGAALMIEPATDLTPDIVSPRPSTSIAPSKGCRREMNHYGTPGRRCRRLIAAGSLLVAALGFFSAQAAAGTIEVHGNRRIDAETVRSYFHATPDGRFDAAARDAGLKALLGTGLFDNVTIDRVGDRLGVHLKERPGL